MHSVAFHRLLPAAAALLFLVAGCRRDVARQDAADRGIPDMRRAIASEQGGDLDGAIALYEQVLLDHPRTASAHLALALLLHDHRQNYIEAIYHYRRYVALRPKSEKEDAFIVGRIKNAEQLLAAQCVRRINSSDASDQAAVIQQLQRANDRLVKAESEKAQLQDQNTRLTRDNTELRGQIARLQRWVDRLQVPVPGGAAGGGTVRAPGEGGGRTYEVRQGDSLSRIAEKVYGDPTLWPRIRDANRDLVSDGERVKVGDVLAIP